MLGSTHLGGVPPAAYAELLDYLRVSGSTLSPAEAIGRALKHWMAAQREAAAPVQGYQWKCLFLPSGSRVRMHHEARCHYAEVSGEDLLYQGRPVSPRQFTLMVAGPGRNAWRELWVRLNGEKNWVRASKLRADLEQRATPTSPAEVMIAAARGMSEALQTTLALMEHASHEAAKIPERRLPKHRRLEDYMIDDCKAD